MTCKFNFIVIPLLLLVAIQTKNSTWSNIAIGVALANLLNSTKEVSYE